MQPWALAHVDTYQRPELLILIQLQSPAACRRTTLMAVVLAIKWSVELVLRVTYAIVMLNVMHLIAAVVI
ncbi:MAG: hypothetical protein A6F71_10015 [Cycloclasticus sp. symbiont of Poecilosclerida sp. M]|nr:MAG: hypothetical protein A6F71_10015 [Cycloclasticus sp. symbiont of Poecilosclerida sp. M]